MGKVVAAVVFLVVEYFTYGTGGFAAALGGSSFAEAAVTIVNAFAISTVISGIAQALSPSQNVLSTILAEYTSTIAPRVIIYGRLRVSGMNAIPPITTGSNNVNLHQVLVLAGHQIDGFDSYYASQTAVTPGAITGGPNDGLISAGNFANKMWVRGYKGTSSQTVDYILNNASPTTWDSTHRLRGMAYLAITYAYDSVVYAYGKPEMTVTVRGKLCYDPRLDSSPGANPTNPSYIAFTSNPALINADYLTDTELGRGVPPSRINWTDVVTAANHCDESITGANAPPSGTQVRFTCNTALAAAATPEEHDSNQAQLASSMLGYVWRANGVWRMIAGTWTTPSFSLTQANVCGAIRVASEIPIRDKFNSMTATYISAANYYQQIPMQPVQIASYITLDGTTRWKDIRFSTCTDEYECQRDAILLLAKGRDRRTVVIDFDLSAYDVKVMDTGAVTIPELGWSNQSVRCIKWTMTPEGLIQLTLKEEYSTDYTTPLTAAYTVPTAAPGVTAATTGPGAPTSLTATAVPAGLSFAIVNGNPYITGQTYRLYQATHGAAFGTATLVAEAVSNNITLPLADTTTRDYWVTAKFAGIESAQYPAGSGVAAAAGQVDPTTAIVSQKGSMAASVPDTSFTYTSTSSSVTISWGAMTIYRADGTTGAISSGNQTVTGLSASTTYETYAYAVDNGTGTLSMSFVTGTSGTAGSPAICLASTATLAQLATLAAGAYQQANIPLYKITTVTPASGSGGGSGGGGGGCLHPDQWIDTPTGKRRAGALKVGDKVLTVDGDVAISKLTRPSKHEWISFGFDNGERATVTLGHWFVRPDGELVAAANVRVGEILGGAERNVEVLSMRLMRTEAACVSLELPDPHLYLITKAGPLSHNPKP